MEGEGRGRGREGSRHSKFSLREEEQGGAVGRYGSSAELAPVRLARPGLTGESRRT